MPIHLSNLLGDLTLAQAESMIAQAKAAGARADAALFDVLDPVREDEKAQRRNAREAASIEARESARIAREGKADK